jgi:hypothetical protein
MQRLIDARLDAVFDLYDELIASLDGAQLRQSLPVPSNPIGMQLWCVVGARETWARAMETGTWGPFRCSISSFEDVQKPRACRQRAGEQRRGLLMVIAHSYAARLRQFESARRLRKIAACGA